MGIFDELKEVSAKFADTASKKANEALDLGKKKVNEISLENDLSKAQKQLGILVYTLYKSGEENEELVSEYIQRIVAIETEIENLKDDLVTTQATQTAPTPASATEVVYTPTTEVISEPAEAVPTSAPATQTQYYQTPVCKSCGAVVASEDIFCKGCGEKQG